MSGKGFSDMLSGTKIGNSNMSGKGFQEMLNGSKKNTKWEGKI